MSGQDTTDATHIFAIGCTLPARRSVRTSRTPCSAGPTDPPYARQRSPTAV